MDFTYTEEQQLLADSVARLIDKAYDFESRKTIVGSATGWSEKVWASFAELGLLGLSLPEDAGGFGGGATDLISVMESIGAGLVVEPYLSTVALGGRLVARYGSAAQRESIVPGIVEGSRKLAFAHTEDAARYDLAYVETRASRSGNGWTLNGAKAAVPHAPMADLLVVSARTAGATGDREGISLFLVDPRTTGVSLATFRTVDNQRAADITFKDVSLGADALLGSDGDALPAIEEAADFATALLCAEAVGAMKFTNDTTLEYLKTRKQFGVPIGTFQALQHRMVDMTMSAEQSRSMSYLACTRVDAAARGEVDAKERARVVSAAKIRIAQACRHVGQEAIQLHGGMGMTQELKVSHAFKRLTMIGLQLGDLDHHLERFAGLDR